LAEREWATLVRLLMLRGKQHSALTGKVQPVTFVHEINTVTFAARR
jgi:hypothetical protein